jgi:hypothetical protein
VFRSAIAVVVGLIVVALATKFVPGTLGFEVIVPRVAGDPVPEPATQTSLAVLVLLHLVLFMAAGAVTAVLAPAGRKMLSAATVSFFGSLLVGVAVLFMPTATVWAHGLEFCSALLGPVLGAWLLARNDSEPSPANRGSDPRADDSPATDAPPSPA